MATITPPYADPGRASFEVLDTYQQNFLLAGNHPELKPAYSFPLPNNVNYAQFSVVGLNSAGQIIMATEGVDPAAATGTLTFSGAGTANDTITVGDVVYTLVAAADDEGEVTIGGSAALSAAAFAAAINGDDNNEPHPDVTASVASAVVTLTAKQIGSVGNQIVTAESGSGTAFGATTLTGGRDQGGVRALGVLAHAASLGANPAVGRGQVWYSGAFNMDALVWDDSFDTDAKKEAAFRGAPTPTTIIIAKRGE
jgi:hypothetical protein